MSLPLLVPGPGAAAPPQTTWHVRPMPRTDPAAVRRVASAYGTLEGELRASAAGAAAALSRLPGAWTGAGATASAHPAAVLGGDADLFCRGLVEAVAALQECAGKLEQAEHAHAWSLAKVLKVGAVVVVSGGAVVVTAGLAAPEVAAADSAVIGAEVAGAELAVASATAAGSEVAIGLTASTRLLTALRGLTAFLRPQLPWALGLTGADATAEMVRDDRLDPAHLLAAFGLDLLLPVAIGRVRTEVAALPALAGRPLTRAAAGHLATGYVAATFDAGRQQLLTGTVDPHHVLRAGLEGTGLSAVTKNLPRLLGGGSSVSRSMHDPGTSPRQTLSEALRDGADLRAHEGVFLGHAVSRHVGRSWEYLQYRLDTEPGKSKSSFFDQATADAAATEVLRSRPDVVAHVETTVTPSQTLVLPLRRPLGPVLGRDGSRTIGTVCRIVLANDGEGGYIKSAMVQP